MYVVDDAWQGWEYENVDRKEIGRLGLKRVRERSRDKWPERERERLIEK